MRATKNTHTKSAVMISAEELKAMLGVGHYTAMKIATEAEAKLYCGKRLLIHKGKIEQYLEEESGR